MTTGHLHRRTGRLGRTSGRSNGNAGISRKLDRAFRTPVPSWNVLFPAPAGLAPGHELFELFQAVRRICQDRRAEYRAKALHLGAAELASFIREDVLTNLLATERTHLGPFTVEQFRFLSRTRHWAWLPAHRKRAEAALVAFQRYCRKKKLV